MKKILYKLFGHKWKYAFTSSIGGKTRFDFRVCLRTDEMQYLYKDDTKLMNDGEPFWMNAVSYTDKGAENHYKPELLK